MGKKAKTKTTSKDDSDTNNIQNQAKVLIIDDERLLRQSIKKILERAGFYCETAFDFQTAKKCVENLHYDLILADIVLPKMSGIKLIATLQEEFDLDAAIIFITGEPNLETAMQAIHIGASDYLEKPVSRGLLIETIQNVLIRKKHELEVLENNTRKPITLNQSFFNLERSAIDSDSLKKIKESIELMHKSLVTLKKKFGNDFNEEQRTLLNNIAQNNAALKKILKEFPE
ncbi:response regulator [Candidatus Lokiarchaeum ossiferum]|uniref:response regulator n=1 Tax=Candidatus Lokiarchaeum ossiferum TaxID=2951803 RepID=UPI00352E9577